MEKKNNKKVWKIVAIVTGVAALGAGAFALFRGGHVDTEQLTEAVETTFEELTDNSGDFMEA